MHVAKPQALRVSGAPLLSRKLRLSARRNALPKPSQFAAATGLRWVSDASSGIRRVKHGDSFSYRTPSGRIVRDPATRGRIRALAIPPAWTNVWICTTPHGHIQATGIDARGRKQYRYHPFWRKTRDQAKFDRMIAFGKMLPQIRRVTERHLRSPGLPRTKVFAAIVQLLEKTLIRVGNEEYARDNAHFGLTTMRDRHATVHGRTITFRFPGKSGVLHDLQLQDARLAAIVRASQELPDQQLFAYRNPDGTWSDVTSSDINAYLKEISGQDFTAKDFRTWAGTVLVARALQEYASFDSQAQAQRNIVRAVESVARQLGNTKTVCRKCYIHPDILDAYIDGSLIRTFEQRARAAFRTVAKLRPEEAAVLAFLQERLRRHSQCATRP